jgi:hypothetical protein
MISEPDIAVVEVPLLPDIVPISAILTSTNKYRPLWVKHNGRYFINLNYHFSSSSGTGSSKNL